MKSYIVQTGLINIFSGQMWKRKSIFSIQSLLDVTINNSTFSNEFINEMSFVDKRSPCYVHPSIARLQ